MLSERALQYLTTLDRREIPTDPTDVADVLRSRDLPTPEAILAFQEAYGGYTFHAGLEPLVATILFPRADFLRNEPWTVPDAITDSDQILFRCFDTLYQCEFHLDTSGTYYEDGNPVHENFTYLIESKALLADLSESGGWDRVVDAHEMFADQSTFPAMGLSRDVTASCRFTFWWHDDDTVIQWRSDDIAAWTRTANGR